MAEELEVIYTLGYTRNFAASHVLQGHAFCGKLHGHTYRVRVIIQGDPEPETHNMIANDVDFFERLTALRDEIHNRHLNDMLPGVIPSAQGLANWFWERLALHYKLDEVTVWQDDLQSSLRRE